MTRHWPLTLLAAAAFAAGCPAGVPPIQQPSQAPLVRKQTVGSVVTGRLLAPSNVIASDGASVIASDGASVVSSGGLVIASDGASVIATGGLNYRAVQQAGTEVRVANAEVYLADASGEPIPGLPTVKTDANGIYTIPKVPAGYSYMVVARVALKQGDPARLTTLVRSTAQGVTAPISGESTLAATGVTRSFSGALGEYNPARFTEAIQLVRANVSGAGPINWASLTEVAAKIDQLEKRVGALESAISELRMQVQRIEKSLEELKADVAQIKDQKDEKPPVSTPSSPPVTPSASPAASASPVPNDPNHYSLPAQFVPKVAQSGFPVGGWTYMSVPDPSAPPASPPPPSYTFFVWGVHANAKVEAYIDPQPGPALVYAREGRMVVHPGAGRPTLINWRAPGPGTVSLKAKIDPSINGAGSVAWAIAAFDPASTPASKPVASGISNTESATVDVKDIVVQENGSVNFSFSDNGDPRNDTRFFTVDIQFTPR
jgi:hypothetical protein